MVINYGQTYTCFRIYCTSRSYLVNLCASNNEFTTLQVELDKIPIYRPLNQLCYPAADALVVVEVVVAGSHNLTGSVRYIRTIFSGGIHVLSAHSPRNFLMGCKTCQMTLSLSSEKTGFHHQQFGQLPGATSTKTLLGTDRLNLLRKKTHPRIAVFAMLWLNFYDFHVP